VSASKDDHAIEAVAAGGAHPALGEGVRVRRSDRRRDHLDFLGAKDLVEGVAELRVAVVDQQFEAAPLLAQLHDEVPSLLRPHAPSGLAVQAMNSNRVSPMR
jgi:hypothetical protein